MRYLELSTRGKEPIADCIKTSTEQWRLFTDYFPQTGDYHFHAIDEDETPFAGASGNTSVGDIGRLFPEEGIPRNPHAVNLVVTKLLGNEFNANAYLRVDEDTAIDLDIGNYEFQVVE